MFSSKQLGGKQEKSEILLILNKYKDTFKHLVDNLDIEYPAIKKQIDLPSNDIPGFKDNTSDPEMRNDLFNISHGQQQRRITPPHLGF